jgi:hypothetical protein
MQAQAQANAAKYQAQVAEMNAQISRDNAQREIQVSQLEQQRKDQDNAALLGEQVVIQGASGLALGGRSQMLTRKSAKQLSRADSFAVRYAGELNKYNHLVEASNQTANAELKRMEASAASTAGFFNAFGSLLGAASAFSGSRSTSRKYTPVPTQRQGLLVI